MEYISQHHEHLDVLQRELHDDSTEAEQHRCLGQRLIDATLHAKVTNECPSLDAAELLVADVADLAEEQLHVFDTDYLFV